ncbi:MAG: hypothetical protein Q4C91_04980 [Eubacteriales bacterium]|nr:hypothetical protein [Eubacteriales bacterium]
MKDRTRKIVVLITVVCCLAITCVSVMADTVWFTLTLHHGGGSVGEPDDALSKKVLKNTDGDKKFWITQESFDNSGNSKGAIRAYSQITGQDYKSVSYIPLKAGKNNILSSATYGWSYIPGGIYYNIISEFGGGSVNRATGRYTP